VTPTQQTSQGRENWRIFCTSRLEYLSILGEVVEKGFTRRDTLHPAFCGCIDWHSSVHGAYALLTAARLTGQSRWVEAVDAALTSECLDAELIAFRQGDLDHELPYGYAWFLKLAKESEQGWVQSDLLPLATEIASRLEEWIISLSDESVIHHAQRKEYGNLSWALLNLWEWSQWKGNVERSEKLLNFMRTRIIPLEQSLSPSHDDATDEFFSAALQRTRAILSILPPDESQTWLTSFNPNQYFLEPMSIAPTPHSAGLNFSRAWGFWTLFACTGNEIYRKLYADHIVTHLKQPQYWRENYRQHAHWVPQFGIYAIALSMDARE
jgi:hypothetical protein